MSILMLIHKDITHKSVQQLIGNSSLCIWQNQSEFGVCNTPQFRLLNNWHFVSSVTGWTLDTNRKI